MWHSSRLILRVEKTKVCVCVCVRSLSHCVCRYFLYMPLDNDDMKCVLFVITGPYRQIKVFRFMIIVCVLQAQRYKVYLLESFMMLPQFRNTKFLRIFTGSLSFICV